MSMRVDGCAGNLMRRSTCDATRLRAGCETEATGCIFAQIWPYMQKRMILSGPFSYSLEEFGESLTDGFSAYDNGFQYARYTPSLCERDDNSLFEGLVPGQNVSIDVQCGGGTHTVPSCVGWGTFGFGTRNLSAEIPGSNIGAVTAASCNETHYVKGHGHIHWPLCGHRQGEYRSGNAPPMNYDEIDLDGDGSVSLDEVSEFFRNCRNISVGPALQDVQMDNNDIAVSDTCVPYPNGAYGTDWHFEPSINEIGANWMRLIAARRDPITFEPIYEPPAPWPPYYSTYVGGAVYWIYFNRVIPGEITWDVIRTEALAGRLYGHVHQYGTTTSTGRYRYIAGMSGAMSFISSGEYSLVADEIGLNSLNLWWRPDSTGPLRFREQSSVPGGPGGTCLGFSNVTNEEYYSIGYRMMQIRNDV